MNKFYAKGKMKQGIGTGPAKGDVTNVRGAMSSSMPEHTAAWPGVPGPTQRGARNNGIPTRGKLGPFRNKSEGI